MEEGHGEKIEVVGAAAAGQQAKMRARTRAQRTRAQRTRARGARASARAYEYDACY